MVPPQALGQGPTRNEQMLGDASSTIAKRFAKLRWTNWRRKKARHKRGSKSAKSMFTDAITKRIDVVGKQGLSALQLAKLQDDVVRESEDVPISDTYEGHKEQDSTPGAEYAAERDNAMLEDHEIPQGAMRGPDGHVYGPHPEMPGTMARITRRI